MTHRFFTKRSAGVLLHVTSLPGEHGIGDFGPAAHRFLDWLGAAGWNTWQVLPIGPLGKGDSPYSSPSSFAIEPLLVSIDGLVADGLLPRSAARSTPALRSGNTSYPAARRFKEPRLRAAFEAFHRAGGERRAGYRRFLERADEWLPDWCDWSVANRGGEAERHAFIQYVLDRQWNAIRRAARDRGIRLFGDLPIFVPLESADVAANPELFQLDRKGRPTAVSGVPPDCFSRDGQLWGHPQYRWSAHRRNDFAWWTRRIAAQFERFDIVRIDHFVGLQRAWHVPARARTARGGRWKPSPGRALLEAFHEHLPGGALVAEDLGSVTPAVRRLRDDFGLPGMHLLHNAFHEDDSPDLPHNLPVHSVLYTGTHDNDTTSGWWRRLSREGRRRVEDLTGGIAESPSASLVSLALAARSIAAIIPMQDLLGLGPGTRMNTPGVPEGNWRWRLGPGMLRKRDAARLRRLARTTGRLGGRGADREDRNDR